MAKFQSYNARAVSGEFAKSAQKGTPYANVIFETQSGERFPWAGYFTSGTAERTINSLKLCGCNFPNDDLTNLDGLGKNMVQIQVEDTDYGPRVAWVNAIGGISEEAKLDGAAKKALAAEMKGYLKGAGGGASKRPATVRQDNPFAGGASTGDEPWNQGQADDDARPAATGTDDIPF